jgi:t-SNARE complex subunit (syntaxin)
MRMALMCSSQGRLMEAKETMLPLDKELKKLQRSRQEMDASVQELRELSDKAHQDRENAVAELYRVLGSRDEVLEHMAAQYKAKETKYVCVCVCVCVCVVTRRNPVVTQ